MKTIKRFYQRAESVAAEDGFAIHLDGKAVKTPGGRLLALPTAALAEAVAAEWMAQEEMVLPSSMPLTQLASTALDRVGPERGHIQSELLKYAGTDLLCYRVDHPADLAERQAKAWQPLLDWAALALDAPLSTTTTVVAVAQSAQALAALERFIAAMDVWRLTALQSATAAMGSLILGLALTEGRIDASQAFDLSQLDETYQIEQWGEDYEAADRRAALAADMKAAARFLELLRPI
ncbi:ATPase [Paramagnetospirillum marisnigri]|uniref:ATPase n=1 Tax=Paramagnetospirillum marisnigri TaxID=1285242 RepID=A0A178MX04_9PROT|nr:ATP12 family protein [Paramagnetospirillum marisnigri]OAN53842.1 ATPase [Paramagnetospirillum marisnigri]